MLSTAPPRQRQSSAPLYPWLFLTKSALHLQRTGKKLLPILQYAIANHFIDLPLSYSDRLNSLMSHVICSPTDITGEGASLTPGRRKFSLSCARE